MQKNKITLLSRQSDDINIDFQMILDEINKNYKNHEKKVSKKFGNYVRID